MEMFILYVIVVGMITAVVMGSKIGSKIKRERKAVIESIGPIEEIFLPDYLGGFENSYVKDQNGLFAIVNVKKKSVFCAITESDFVFLTPSGKKLGSIPRNSVNDIILEDKSLVTQRLTATRMLTLGIFSLALPKKKKHKEYCIVFDWEDENLERQNLVFEFSGYAADELAIKAFNSLKKYKKPKLQRLKPDEKTCPHCAETIKAEAKVCKHCGRDV